MENDLAAPEPNGEDKKPRAPRSDKGLPRRRSLLLSRWASARFVRVAAALPGGEEELAGMLEPIVEELFAGSYFRSTGSMGAEVWSQVGPLHELALQAQRQRMIGGSDES